MRIKNAKPEPIKDESETVKWETGKTYIEKVEIQQPDQLTVTTYSAPSGQSLPSLGGKPRICNRWGNAQNQCGAGIMIVAVIQAEDWIEIKKELLAETPEFWKPRKWKTRAGTLLVVMNVTLNVVVILMSLSF